MHKIIKLIPKFIFVIVLLSMIAKPVHTFLLNISNELVVEKFEDVSDKDSHQEDDNTEEDSKDSKEEFKILSTTEVFYFSFFKESFTIQQNLHASLVQETFLPPPDFV